MQILVYSVGALLIFLVLLVCLVILVLVARELRRKPMGNPQARDLGLAARAQVVSDTGKTVTASISQVLFPAKSPSGGGAAGPASAPVESLSHESIQRQTNAGTADPFGKGIMTSPLRQPRPDNAKLYLHRHLTDAESRFYDFLEATVEGRCLIQTKVPLKDIIKRYGWLDKPLYWMYKYGHIDFLLLEPNFKHPLLAIELDDAAHMAAHRQAADQRKDELFQRANLNLLRFKSGKIWGEQDRKLIREALSLDK